MLLIGYMSGFNNRSKNTWIANSGASCHIVSSLEGMADLKDLDHMVKVGDGKTTFHLYLVAYFQEFQGKEDAYMSNIRLSRIVC